MFALNIADANHEHNLHDMTAGLIAWTWNCTIEKVANDAAKVRLECNYPVENWPSAEGDE
ncbi:MAG: hypothetical protein CL581_10985 [Alteromonadaceae bacterium]|nr:hypothetical protein [Alteromonadaceae bacterium]MAA65287.1 hypothetical protein [Alteromonadaceae bacterium]